MGCSAEGRWVSLQVWRCESFPRRPKARRDDAAVTIAISIDKDPVNVSQSLPLMACIKRARGMISGSRLLFSKT